MPTPGYKPGKREIEFGGGRATLNSDLRKDFVDPMSLSIQEILDNIAPKQIARQNRVGYYVPHAWAYAECLASGGDFYPEDIRYHATDLAAGALAQTYTTRFNLAGRTEPDSETNMADTQQFQKGELKFVSWVGIDVITDDSDDLRGLYEGYLFRLKVEDQQIIRPRSLKNAVPGGGLNNAIGNGFPVWNPDSMRYEDGLGNQVLIRMPVMKTFVFEEKIQLLTTTPGTLAALTLNANCVIRRELHGLYVKDGDFKE